MSFYLDKKSRYYSYQQARIEFLKDLAAMDAVKQGCSLFDCKLVRPPRVHLLSPTL